MSSTITTAITAVVKCTLVLVLTLERKMYVKGTGSWCVLEECVKGNYYARLHTHRHSYHCYREMHFNSTHKFE